MDWDDDREFWHEEEPDLEYLAAMMCDDGKPLVTLALGNIHYSPDALQLCSISELQVLLGRYKRADWGESPPDWLEANRKAFHTGRLIRSYYRLSNNREICIETGGHCWRAEWDQCRHTHIFVPYEVLEVCRLLSDYLLSRF
ncbi:MAG: hypothetical protein ACRCZF_26665 [Gemmataceae bacterium]